MAENIEFAMDTNIRGVEDVKKELASLEKQLEKVTARMEKYREVSGNDSKAKGSKTYKNMQYDYEMLQDKIADLNQELSWFDEHPGIKKQAENVGELKKACVQAGSTVKKLEMNVKKSNKTMSLGAKKLLLYVIGIRSLFDAIRKIKSGITQGLKNLAQFNDGVNPVNESLSRLKSALTQLKNSFGAAFAPILTAVEPVLTRIINLISELVTQIGMLFAKLNGQTTFTRAIKVQEDYAKSLGGVNDKLASFDELNVLSEDSGSANPADMFETVDIEANISGFAQRMYEVINGVKQGIADWFTTVDFQPLIESFGRLKDAVLPIIDKIGKAIAWLLESVLGPMAKFFTEKVLPAAIDVLSAAFTLLDNVIQALTPGFEYIWLNVIKPIGEFAGEVFVKFLNSIKVLISDVADAFKANGDKIGLILQTLGKAIEVLYNFYFRPYLGFIAGVFTGLLEHIGKVVGDIIQVLGGVIEFIAGVFTGDWERAWNGIKNIFSGVWNFILDVYMGVVNAIIDGLNMISVKVPDWLPVPFAGKTFGFNLQRLDLSKYKIPALATGTVVPASSREFIAKLGDNNTETEVVSPLSTMKQAFLEAMAESGFGGNANVNVYLEGNAKGLFRVVRQEASDYFRTTGDNALVF